MFALAEALGFIMFFTAVTDAIRLTIPTRQILMFLSFAIFVGLVFSAFNIEKVFCESDATQANTTVANMTTYTNAWSCTTQKSYDMAFVGFNMIFALAAILFITLGAFGMIPNDDNYDKP